MLEGFKRVQARLPFPILHLHPDNGSEFFNDHLLRHFGETITGLRLSRSWPYQKNDSLVRAYSGYSRLESFPPMPGDEWGLGPLMAVRQLVLAGAASSEEGGGRRQTEA